MPSGAHYRGFCRQNPDSLMGMPLMFARCPGVGLNSVYAFLHLFIISSSLLPAACGNEQNDPYPASERGQNILYSAFTERPKHLDPAQSYTEDVAH